ncbi:glycosyl hydrolase family 18 protein [Paenibacillus methanolicus]|uniref:chitinase n=1 Tax=Paenibacillus methanolicus TaxID=582686 RepID=A0A5S5BT18_9BACL|nr:glycosyl hydrolase family 18 protein [Paenibacillus methanolicus]TYP70084.1 chitinase [Paenibacillus methanolicus]
MNQPQSGTSPRKRKLYALSMLSAMLFSLLPLPAAPQGEAEAASAYKIIGYYPSWSAYGRSYNVTDMDVSKVTHINYAFADICWNGIHGNSDPTGPNPTTWACQDEVGNINAPNGTIVLGDPFIDAQKTFPGDKWDDPIRGNINQLNKLKAANPHLKTIISVGGWTWSNRFSDVAADAATRETFANSAVAFLRKYKFDGVDLDWEYPVGGGLAGNSVRPADKQNYTLLLNKIREKLDAAEKTDGKEYLLTIASGAGPSYIQNTELDKIAAAVDWINIMTYDFNGGWQTLSAHNAPLYNDPAAAAAGVPNSATFHTDAAIQAYFAAGVPADKLVMGTPFYGRGWAGCAGAGGGQYQPCGGAAQIGTWEKGSFDFYDLEANYINKNGYARYWNDVAKVPYLYNATNKTYISYDDVESTGYKTAYIKSKNLAGAMFWEFSGDRNKTLLNKLAGDLGVSGGGGGTPADTAAPSAPAGVTVTGATSSSVSLSWTASTDNVGVTGYTVSYGGASVNVTGTSATIGGLTAGTAYSFTVKAKDAAGNVSAASGAVTGTTTAAQADTAAPSVPAGVTVTGATSSSVSLSWIASTDNVGVTGYTVGYGTSSVNVTGTTATIGGLTAGTAYSFTVKAKDAAGNVSAASGAVAATTAPANACTVAAWNATAVYTGGQRVSYNGTLYEAKWWTQGNQPGQGGDSSPWKAVGTCGSAGGGGTPADTAAPSAPAGLAASGVTSSSVTLSWTASTDNVGVTGYTVSYGGSSVNVTGTTATISGLTAGAAYSFTVKAKDAAGNLSAASGALSVTTTASGTGGGTGTTAGAWTVGKAYKAGDEVAYGGKTYVCLQPHTAQTGWEPAATAALWKLK